MIKDTVTRRSTGQLRIHGRSGAIGRGLWRRSHAIPVWRCDADVIDAYALAGRKLKVRERATEGE
jgi:hypothetical protein